MIRKWFSVAALILTAITAVEPVELRPQPETGSDQVTPATATFGGVGAQIQFKAIGTYIHPPENKDITDQAKWSIDSQNLVTINGPGNVTAISDCGTGNVIASIQDGAEAIFVSYCVCLQRQVWALAHALRQR